MRDAAGTVSGGSAVRHHLECASAIRIRVTEVGFACLIHANRRSECYSNHQLK